jgi:long-chain acyl-CoA synthetase
MTITALLEERARQFGDKTFLNFEEREFSYRMLHENASFAAANLAARGVANGDKVVLLLGNCPEFLYLFLGLGRIGGVMVPVNPTLKPDEIAYITNNADATTIVTIPDLMPLVNAIRKDIPTVEHVFVLGDKGVDGAEPFSHLLEPVAGIPEIAATEDSEAALIYTSGTTGMPKGVMLTHRNYYWNALAVSHTTNLGIADKFLCILPLFHVNAQVVTMLMPLVCGAGVVLMGRMNLMGILPLITKHRVTIMSGVPTIYNLLCSLPKAGEHDLSSMRFFVSGAAPLPEETYQLTQRVLKKPLIMGYGLSEATCASAVADYLDPIRPNSVGPALRYCNIRIVDRHGSDVPPGEIGEIIISGPTVMKGYYKNPEATAQVLKNGWLYTGDLGKMDAEGYVYIVGRLKDMIIRGGQNIYPVQIENVLSRYKGVEEACVVGVEEPRWGQEVLAVIKPFEGARLNEREIIDYCTEHLAQYKVPQYVRFVESLPKTPTGKIKKNEVAASFADIALKKKPRK